jgi:TonB-linked SusC/RagA family outer membrane protein
MRAKIFLLICSLLLAIAAQAQTRTVTGIVIEKSNGEPIVGASVIVKGTNNGDATNIDGQFKIPNVPAGAKTLVVTYVGMNTQEVPIHSGEIRIEMEETSAMLDEVMVVAYGTAKKSAFTGSAAVIKSDEIAESQVSNVLNAMDGRVAGVQLTNSTGQPGASTPTIRIRGISSISAGNAPLIIVDGAPYSGDVSNISSSDIASMTVLKDAASNALYGARGANGVILITTKKGTKNEEATVTLDAKWGMNSKAIRNYQYITDPAQYYETYYSALYNNRIANGKTAQEAHLWANSNLINGAYGLGYNVYNIPQGQYMIGGNGRLNPNATVGNIVNYNGQDYLLSPDNWLDYAYKTSLRQEYNLSVSSGTQKSNFFASFSYLDNEGITTNSGYERLTGRLSADTQALSWLKVGANVSYTHFEAKSTSSDGETAMSNNVFAVANQMAPIYPLYIRGVDGQPLINSDGITRYDYGDGTNAGLQRPQFAISNAVSDALLNTNKYNGNSVNATGFININLPYGFKFTSNNNVSVDERRYNQTSNPYFGSGSSSGGMNYVYHYRTMDYMFQQLLNWDQSYGENNISILLGHENYNYRYTTLGAGKSGVLNTDNVELDGAIINNYISSNTTDYNNEGWLMRAQYDFSTKYFASFSIRRDGSSRFHPDHRWGTFWSLGGAWNMHKEAWWGVSWLDMFKLKASYGEQGNDNIGNFRYVDTYTLSNSGGKVSVIPYMKGNENITWEKNGNFNAGVEFDILNGRLSGSVEAFYRRTSDMLTSVSLPGSYGWTSYYDNIGNMKNVGVEIELNSNVIHTKDLNWNLNFNLTWYKNRITSIYENNKRLTLEGHGGYTSGNYFYGEGCALYSFYLPSYAGVDPETGQALYYYDITDADGNVTGRGTTTDYGNKATYYLHDSALPSVYGGFGTSLEYRGFDFSINFSYSIGGKVYDSDYQSAMISPTTSSRGFSFHKDILNAWTPTNTSTDVPRLCFDDQYTASTSDRFLTDASYLSLQNINLGYTLPTSVSKKIKLQKIRFYLSADNVWLWSKRRGLDPRQSLTGSTTASAYAPIRTVSGGLNIVF